MLRFTSRRAGAPIVLVGILVGAIVGWLALWNREKLPADSSLPFLECATEVGLTWKMNFLTNESGEHFKINMYDHGSGLAVGDFDGDGFDDIYFCNQLGPNALYRNKGDGTFEEVAAKAGVALGDRVCASATFVDYRNEGRQSLFVTSTRGGNVLFRNMGDGTFKDVTVEAGLKHIGHSQGVVFFDFNNDGYLDLLVTNTARWTTDMLDTTTHAFVGSGDGFGGIRGSPKESNILYRNNGDGTFTDVTEKSGLKGLGWAADVVAFDYNGDGRMDLFITNMFGRSQLYRNNGDGTFTDVTREVLGRTPWGAIGAQILDYNNDGRLDLYVVDMHSDMWMGADWEHKSFSDAVQFEKTKFPDLAGPAGLKTHEAVLGMEKDIGVPRDQVFFGNGFYRNEGKGKFTEISDQAGLETFWPWGIASGDFDNDGLEDLFIPAGMGHPFYYWPNSLMMNQGDGTFRDRAEKLGIEPPPRGEYSGTLIKDRKAARSSRTAAVADFTRTGRLDIVVNNFNDQPYFFKNRFARKNSVAFQLRGTQSNRDAIGAVVRLYQGKKIMTRQVQAGGGYLSQSSRTLHFGLGDQPTIDRVEITWPSGTVQELKDIAANERHAITEPGKDRWGSMVP